MASEDSTAEVASKRFRIYTRTGDSGTSCLYTGQRLPKDCAFFEALGDVDELNSCIGVAREFTAEVEPSVAAQLEIIQSRLLDVGSAVATPANASQGVKVGRTRFDGKHSTVLEGWIDAMDASLPPLRYFILPSGGKASAFLHSARSVCRRAERSVVSLARMGQQQQIEQQMRQKQEEEHIEQQNEQQTRQQQPNEQQQNLPQRSEQKQPSLPASGSDEEEASRLDVAAAELGLVGDNSIMDPNVPVYLNRLSDYLFTAARYMAMKEGKPEVTYQKAACHSKLAAGLHGGR